MTKTKRTAPTRSIHPTLVVIGFDRDGKPHGGLVRNTEAAAVTKAAQALSFKAYRVTSRKLALLANRLPDGKLDDSTGLAIPEIPQTLYSEIAAALVADPRQALTKAGDEPKPTKAPHIPTDSERVTAGDVVIAEEGPGYGWWPAMVVERTGDILFLRYLDYPGLPQFARHRSCVAMMHAPAK